MQTTIKNFPQNLHKQSNKNFQINLKMISLTESLKNYYYPTEDKFSLIEEGHATDPDNLYGYEQPFIPKYKFVDDIAKFTWINDYGKSKLIYNNDNWHLKKVNFNEFERYEYYIDFNIQLDEKILKNINDLNISKKFSREVFSFLQECEKFNEFEKCLENKSDPKYVEEIIFDLTTLMNACETQGGMYAKMEPYFDEQWLFAFIPCFDGYESIKEDFDFNLRNLNKNKPQVYSVDKVKLFVYTVHPDVLISDNFHELFFSLFNIQDISGKSIFNPFYFDRKIVLNGNDRPIIGAKKIYFEMANKNPEMHTYSLSFSVSQIEKINIYSCSLYLPVYKKSYTGSSASKNLAELMAFDEWYTNINSNVVYNSGVEVTGSEGEPVNKEFVQNVGLETIQEITLNENSEYLDPKSMLSETSFSDPNLLNVPVYLSTVTITANTPDFSYDYMSEFFKAINNNVPQFRVAQNYSQFTAKAKLHFAPVSSIFNSGIWGVCNKVMYNLWSFPENRANMYSYSQMNPAYINLNTADVVDLELKLDAPTKYLTLLNSTNTLQPLDLAQVQFFELNKMSVTEQGTQKMDIAISIIFETLEFSGRIPANNYQSFAPNAGLLGIGKKILSAQTGGLSDVGFSVLDKVAKSYGMGKNDYPIDPSQGQFLTPNFSSSLSVVKDAVNTSHSFSLTPKCGYNSELELSDSFIALAKRKSLFRQFTVDANTAPGTLLTSWSNVPRKPASEYAEMPVGSGRRAFTSLGCVSDNFLNYSGEIDFEITGALTSKHHIKLLIVTAPVDNSVTNNGISLNTLRNSKFSYLEFGKTGFVGSYTAPYFGNKEEMRVLNYSSEIGSTASYVPSETYVFAVTALTYFGVSPSVQFNIFEKASDNMSFSVFKCPSISPISYKISEVINLVPYNSFQIVNFASGTSVIRNLALYEYGVIYQPLFSFYNIAGNPPSFIVRRITATTGQIGTWRDAAGAEMFVGGNNSPFGLAMTYGGYTGFVQVMPMIGAIVTVAQQNAVNTYNRNPTEENQKILLDICNIASETTSRTASWFDLNGISPAVDGDFYLQVQYATPSFALQAGNDESQWDSIRPQMSGMKRYNESFDSISDLMKRPYQFSSITMPTSSLRNFPFNAFSLRVSPCPDFDRSQTFGSSGMLPEISTCLLMCSSHLGFAGDLIYHVISPELSSTNCFVQYFPDNFQGASRINYPFGNFQPSMQNAPSLMFNLALQPDIKTLIPYYSPSEYIRTVPLNTVHSGDMALINSLGSLNYTFNPTAGTLPANLNLTFMKRFGDHASFYNFIGFPTMLARDNFTNVKKTLIHEVKIPSELQKNITQLIDSKDLFEKIMKFSTDNFNKTIEKTDSDNEVNRTFEENGFVDGVLNVISERVDECIDRKTSNKYSQLSNIVSRDMRELKDSLKNDIKNVKDSGQEMIDKMQNFVTELVTGMEKTFPDLGFNWSTMGTEIISQFVHCVINPKFKTITWSFLSALVNLTIITVSDLHKMMKLLSKAFLDVVAPEPSKATFNTEGPDDSEIQLSAFSTFISLLSSGLSRSLKFPFTFMPSAKQVSSWFKLIKEAFTCANAVSTFFRVNFDIIKNLIIGLVKKLIGDSSQIADVTFIQNMHSVITFWMSEVDFLCDSDLGPEVQSNTELQSRLRVAYLISKMINKQLVQNLNSQLKSLIRDYILKISKLYDSLSHTYWFANLRAAPHVWYFHGTTRIGKSEMVPSLTSYVIGKYNREHPDNKIVFNSGVNYTTNPSSQYMSTLTDHPVILVDDLLAVLAPVPVQSQLSLIFEAITSNTWVVPKAAVDEKNQTCQPKIVAFLSNHASIVHDQISDVDAVNARMQCKWEVALKEDIPHKNGNGFAQIVQDMSEEKINELCPQFSHLKFRKHLVPMSINSAKTDWLSYDEMKAIVYEEFVETTHRNQASLNRRIIDEANAKGVLPPTVTRDQILDEEFINEKVKEFLNQCDRKDNLAYKIKNSLVDTFNKYYNTASKSYKKNLNKVKNLFNFEKILTDEEQINSFISNTVFNCKESMNNTGEEEKPTFSKEAPQYPVSDDLESIHTDASSLFSEPVTKKTSIEDLLTSYENNETYQKTFLLELRKGHPSYQKFIDYFIKINEVSMCFKTVKSIIDDNIFQTFVNEPLETFKVVFVAQNRGYRFCNGDATQCDCEEIPDERVICIDPLLEENIFQETKNDVEKTPNWFIRYFEIVKNVFKNCMKVIIKSLNSTFGKLVLGVLGGVAAYHAFFPLCRLIYDYALIGLDKLFGIDYVKSFTYDKAELVYRQYAIINSFKKIGLELGDKISFSAIFGEEWDIEKIFDGPNKVKEMFDVLTVKEQNLKDFTIKDFEAGVRPLLNDQRLYAYMTKDMTATQAVHYSTSMKHVKTKNPVISTFHNNAGVESNLISEELSQEDRIRILINKNYRFIRLPTKDDKCLYIVLLALGERYHVFLIHYQQLIFEHLKKYPDSEIEYGKCVNVMQDGRLVQEFVKICNLERDHFYNLKTRNSVNTESFKYGKRSEFAIWDAPKQVPLSRNITRHFLHSTQSGLVSNNVKIVPSLLKDVQNCPALLPLLPKNEINSDLREQCDFVFGYKGYHGFGKCCTAVYDPRTLKIIGVHSYGTKEVGKDYGFGEFVYIESFEELGINTTELIEKKMYPNLTPVTDEDIQQYPESLSLIGSVPPHQTCFDNGISCIIPSPMHDAIFTVKKFPAHLTKNPKIDWDPMYEGIKKHGVQHKTFADSTIKLAKKIRQQQLIANCIPSTKDFKPFSMEEAIVGIPDLKFYGVDLRTAPGYAWKKKGQSGKYHLLQIDDGKLTKIDNDLLKTLNLEIEMRNRKIPCHNISVDCTKDETLKEEKRDRVGGTRIFSVQNLSHQIAGKMDFGPFLVAYRECYEQLNHGITINPTSRDWGRVYDRIRKFPNVLEGDYSDFGPQAVSQVVWHAIDNIMVWFEYWMEKKNVDPETRKNWLNRLKCIQEEFVNVPHLCGKIVYETICGIISGSFMTAELNSEINIMYLLCNIIDILRNHGLDDEQIEHIIFTCMYYIVYGDDFLISIDDTIKDKIGMEKLSAAFMRLGIKVTNATKSKDIINFTPVEEMSFLKRQFREDKEFPGIIFAPLNTTSIEDQLNWIRNSGDEWELLTASCDSAIREATQHGKDYFNKLSNLIKNFYLSKGKIYSHPSFQTFINEMYFSELI